MLTLWMGFVATAALQGDSGREPPPPPPQIFSHREAYFLRPPSSTLTAEWTCPQAAPSMAKISIESYFDDQRMQRFRVSLVALRVDGRPANERVFRSVADALAPLTGVGSFDGGCRRAEQQLLVQGFVQGEDPRSPRLLRLDLTP